MKRLAFIAALLLMCGAAFGQQIVVPTEVEQYRLVPATLNLQMPEGLYLSDGGWEVESDAPAKVADVKQTGAELIFTGPPGVYTILYDGVLLQDITFTDGSGATITINSYKGRVKARAVCKIKGTTPPNPPDPPQPTDQKWQMVIVHQAGERLANLPQGQRDLITSLLVRRELASMGHAVLAVRDDNVLSAGDVEPSSIQPFVNAIKKSGVELPAIALAPKSGGDVVVKKLSTDWKSLVEMLEGKAN